MKVALMIEVPDDWKRGEHKNCNYAKLRIDRYTNNAIYLCSITECSCNVANCPLEIQEELKAKPYKCKTKCKDCAFWDICIHADLQENNQ